MKTLSLVMGILSVCGMLLGFIPCLGAFNWINIPFAILGLLISIVAYIQNEKQPKGNAIAGIVLCGITILFGVVRLLLGGGLL